MALSTWLDDALSNLDETLRPQVLTIQILPFSSKATARDESHVRGWPFQLIAPLKTLLSVWHTSQQYNSERHLDLLTRFWAKSESTESFGALETTKRIGNLTIQYSPIGECAKPEAPLSWRLREFEKHCIEESWDRGAKDWVETVKDFIGPDDL